MITRIRTLDGILVEVDSRAAPAVAFMGVAFTPEELAEYRAQAPDATTFSKWWVPNSAGPEVTDELRAEMMALKERALAPPSEELVREAAESVARRAEDPRQESAEALVAACRAVLIAGLGTQALQDTLRGAVDRMEAALRWRG